MDQVTTRPAKPEDLEALTHIYNHEVLHGIATFDSEVRTAEEIRSWLFGTNPRHPTLVAVGERGEVIGFSALYPWSPRKAYSNTVENTVYLDPAHRGRGVGRLLLEAVLEAGRRAGFHTVIARISSENEISVKLHLQLGFVNIGTMREVGHKFGRLLDVDLMQLML